VFWSKDQFIVLDDEASGPDRKVRGMIAKAERLNDQCRGGSGDMQSVQAACEKRDAAYQQIRKTGWCWGHANDIGADRRWVTCRTGD